MSYIEEILYEARELGIYKKGSNPVIYPTFGTAKFNLRGIEYKGIDLKIISETNPADESIERMEL